MRVVASSMALAVAALLANGDASAQDAKNSKDATLRVQVVGSDGKPRGGIPVVITRLSESHMAKGATTRSTDRDGIAVFGGVAALLADPADSSLRIVTLDVLARTPPGVVVDLAAPPAEPVELELPAGGPVQLKLVAAEGGRVASDATGNATAEVESVEFAHVPPLHLAAQKRTVGRVEVEAHAGLARLPFVEDGMTVDVHLKLAALTFAQTCFKSAESAVEPTVAVSCDPTGPMLAGRFVVAAGSALDVTRCDAEVEAASGHSGILIPLSPKVLPDGRFTIDLHGDVDDYTEVRLRFRDAAGSVIAIWRQRVRRDQQGRLDVGEVALAEAKRAVSGLVADDRGRPIAGAVVTINPSFRGGARVQQDDSERLQDLRYFEARSTSDGSFVARSPLSHPAWIVGASAAGFVRREEPPRVAEGSSDVTLQLVRTGSIAGRLLLPDSSAAASCQVLVAGEGRFGEDGDHRPLLTEGVTFGDEERFDVARDGRFELLRVDPGRRTVIIELTTASGWLPQYVDAVVAPGATATLPPIDLRATRFKRQVAVIGVDRTGRVVAQTKVLPIDDDGHRHQPSEGWDSRNCDVTGGPATVDILADGFRSLRIDHVDRDTVVTLEPGLPVSIEVASSHSLAGAHVALVPVDEARRPRLGQAIEAPLDAHGVATFRVGDPGPHDVVVFEPPAPGAADGDWRPLEVHLPGPRIDVVETTTLQEFRVELDAH